MHESDERLGLVGRIRWIARIGVGCPVGDVMFVCGIDESNCPVRERCVRIEHGLYDACYDHALTDRAVDIVTSR